MKKKTLGAEVAFETTPLDDGRYPDARVLSPRQLECLAFAADGMTSPEIAQALGISPRTVDQYFAEAAERLGVRNRTQAVARAVALGLIPAFPAR